MDLITAHPHVYHEFTNANQKGVSLMEVIMVGFVLALLVSAGAL